MLTTRVRPDISRALSPRYTRRPQRRSATERIVERAEERHDRRELRRRDEDPENHRTIPWEEVKAGIGV